MCFSDDVLSSIIFIFVETVALNLIKFTNYNNVRCAQLTCQNTLNLKINGILKISNLSKPKKNYGNTFLLCNQMYLETIATYCSFNCLFVCCCFAVSSCFLINNKLKI